MERLPLPIRRRWWDLQRFGVAPPKLWRRLHNRGAPKVFMNSIPKSGTHLVERALCLHPALYRRIVPTLHLSRAREGAKLQSQLPRRPGQVAVAHLPYRRSWGEAVEAAGCRKLLVIRDPRAVVVSEMHHALRRPDHHLHEHLRRASTVPERLILLIRGEDGIRPPLGEFIEGYLPWLEVGALLLRFEDVIGARGGGDDDVQRRTLTAVLDHLGLDPDARIVARIRTGLFSDASPTFREGSVDAWRDVFDPTVSAVFEEEVGGVMRTLGYDAGGSRGAT